MNVWLLTIFDVPEPLAGLLTRLKFKPTRKNPAHWWRRFRTDERPAAEHACGHLRDAGLYGKGHSSWMEVGDKKPAGPLDGNPRPAPAYRYAAPMHILRTSRSAGYSASMKNRSNQRRRGRGRRGL